ncbi:MAG: DUF938 domain-containing protein, partial [Comamonadaceae bacterium]
MPATPIAPDAPFSGAAERNKEPILDALRRLLPAQGSALEIAAGTGQHAAWFAPSLAGWSWLPSDADPASLEAIRAWTGACPNVRDPILLDVMAAPWPGHGPALEERFDLVYCANMLHIAPWTACAALMRGAARHLAPGGLLATYGPYLEDGVETSAGNLAFDRNLRERNALWGIRRLEDVAREAGHAGLQLAQRHAMPANNL